MLLDAEKSTPQKFLIYLSATSLGFDPCPTEEVIPCRGDKVVQTMDYCFCSLSGR